ncbi:uncharacterized protein LOC106153584 [Lingula anatina]|uniref:Uncharacterized protein LOC106153584 n=1 Tax=Lingula anatina TaxID=7574 RepID=A0A1S3HA94_LINAN|nr:uncharacterized protein LOC106153584 [Lingula anatina]|eukprot:XP_013383015.1 uncharacterized protein LOC106153584 [Lingula anatina]
MEEDMTTIMAILTTRCIVVFLIVITLPAYARCQLSDIDLRKDCGTCGNACCALQFIVGGSSEPIYEEFSNFLMKGGTDGWYFYSDSTDLRSQNVSADFIIQGYYSSILNRYQNTLNFAVEKSTNLQMVSVRAFSISNVTGTYCDAGQNYKNLVQFMIGLKMPYTEVHIWGCPKTKP